MLKNLLFVLLFNLSLPVASQETFTALEQQQISIATPGLFDKSNAFSIELDILGAGDYSFPLPVGKAKLLNDNLVEITTTPGDAVKAMFGGWVRLSRHHPTYGYVVVVRHDNGLETMYAHNVQNLVKVGQRVEAGQTVAIVKAVGKQAYCHFAIMINGGRINPKTILHLSSHRLLKQELLCRKAGETGAHISVVRVDKQLIEAEKNTLHNWNVNTDPFGSKGRFSLHLAEMPATKWAYPLPGAKVISGYGRRGGRSHTGVDLKTKANDDILAAFDGIVTMSQSYHGYGKCIRIKHPNGIETLYSHNSKNLVKVGDKVKAGQVIALTGRTGRATTEHLHFECRVNGVTFDPSYLFNHSTHLLRSSQLTFVKKGSRVNVVRK